MAAGIGCGGGATDGGPVGNTEVNLVISDPATAAAQILPLIDFVSYRITCLNNPDLTQYDDSVDLSGNFELNAEGPTPVWQLVTDLPLSPCTISLWVFYEDEVICSGTEALEIYEDASPLAPNKVNIDLECNLSVNGPSGDLDVDGSFEFIHGNYCPKLVWLGAIPTVVPASLPLETNIQTSSFDPDSTCGLNCDPQTCDFTQTPPLCTAGPDPGLSNTLMAPAGRGTFGTASAFGNPNTLQTIYTCDPLFPGPTEICVVASDGDNDCDQIRCTTIVCPDLCEGVVCDDGNECTRDRCDPLSGLCSNDPAPDGIACDACNSTCQSGACDAGSPFVADFVFSGTIALDAVLQSVDTTFVNPYSGASVVANGLFYVNQSSFLGTSTFDTLAGSGLQDILVARLPSGDQAVCGIERVFSLNSFDILRLADEYVVLGDMEIQGGNAGDVLWANAGNDLLRGNDGDDLIDGGPGNDTIFGETGDDTIALWPGSGFDSIDGGNGTDQVVVDAEQNQITITPAASASYEFDIAYLGTPMAQLIRVEFIEMSDALIDLSLCTGGAGDVCNLCGNDALNGGEGCDDGNNVDGDGCAADCTAEY
jgi:cysteine-rich repeat protein